MTEKEKVGLCRAAWCAGVRWSESIGAITPYPRKELFEMSVLAYPDPKPPREVSLGVYTYRVVDGVLERAAENFPTPLRWEPVPALTSNDVLTLAELVTHPHVEDK